MEPGDSLLYFWDNEVCSLRGYIDDGEREEGMGSLSLMCGVDLGPGSVFRQH